MSISHRWWVPWGLVALLPLACDFPTDPAGDQTTASSGQSVVAASNAGSSALTVQPQSVKLEIGATTQVRIGITYTRGEASEPLPSTLGLITSLGNYGTDANGPKELTQTLTLQQASGNTFTASTTVSYYAGSTTGTATLTASFAGTTQNASVTVAKAAGLFLKSVSPSSGPASGSPPNVQINGQGFTADARVTFGSVAANVVNASSITSSSTSITVQVPQSSVPVAAGTIRVVDVTVEVPATNVTDAQSDTLTGAYTYTPGGTGGNQLPTIQRLDPNFGDNAGSSSPVVIHGSGFANPVQVSIGSGSSQSSFTGVAMPATDISVSGTTKITLDSWPPASPSQLNSAVDVLVVNTVSGLGTVARSAYTYQSPDVVVDIDPIALSYLDVADGVKIDVRGIVAGRTYRLEFGGQSQGTCPSSPSCVVSAPDSSGTFSLRVAPIASVTISSCSPPSGAVKITDTVTTETATGPVFSYTAASPSISSLSSSDTSCSPSGSCSAAAGGGTLTLQGTFSATELASSQVLIDGRNEAISQQTPGSQPDAVTAIQVAIPPFTGSFDEVSCTSGGASGTRMDSKKVDVEVLYTNTGCNAVKPQSLTYVPDNTDCVVATDPPTASFRFAQNQSDPLTFQFFDLSTGASSGSWFFGDGNILDCNGSFPCDTSHAYSDAGNFTVTLRVANSAGSDTFDQSLTAGLTPVAFFTVSAAPALAVPITFTNASTVDSSTICRWSFGNGQTLEDPTCSTNPTQTYTVAGTYTIQLTASNGLGTDAFSVDLNLQ